MLYLTKQDKDKTIRKYKTNRITGKMTVLFNNEDNKGFSKIKMANTRENKQKIQTIQYKQLEAYVNETNPKEGTYTKKQIEDLRKYDLFLKNKKDLQITIEEAKKLGVKRQYRHINKIDKYKYAKLAIQIETLKQARTRFEFLTENGLVAEKKPAKIKKK